MSMIMNLIIDICHAMIVTKLMLMFPCDRPIRANNSLFPMALELRSACEIDFNRANPCSRKKCPRPPKQTVASGVWHPGGRRQTHGLGS